MIKFFRNIRKSMVNEGKTSNYLKYAIGEIVLVVIGILIALQINNWNEGRKQNHLAQKYLQFLYLDFIQNEVMVAHAIEQMEGTKRSARSLAVFIDSGFVAFDRKSRPLSAYEEFYTNYNIYENDYIPIYDTISLVYNLNRSGWVTSYDLILPVWDEIISTGNIQLIKNKNLKNDIVMLHMLADEIKELETKIMTPVVKDYKTVRATYYDVSKSVAGPTDPNEKGLFNNDGLVDIPAIRNNKEIKDQLKLVYRAANEQQDNIAGNISLQSSIIIKFLKEELTGIGINPEQLKLTNQ